MVGRILIDLRYRSRHDGLTGLLNRRAMEETLPGQMQRSRRTGEPFTVLMLDLDHFKTINDRHGHAAGDRALKHTAAALKAELREVDAVGRFGGEEFLVLMPGATVETALPVAERLRTALLTNALGVEGATLLLSASIGIAQWREPAEETVAPFDAGGRRALPRKAAWAGLRRRRRRRHRAFHRPPVGRSVTAGGLHTALTPRPGAKPAEQAKRTRSLQPLHQLARLLTVPVRMLWQFWVGRPIVLETPTGRSTRCRHLAAHR